MTRAISILKQHKIPYQLHEYTHEAGVSSYGMEAAAKLSVDPARILKTLIVQSEDGRFHVCVIPVVTQLNLKRAAAALGVKKIELAGQADAARMTGYVIGGISPIGQKRQLPTFIDSCAEGFESVYVSGGRRGLDIELAPGDLGRLVQAIFAELSD